MENTDTTDNKNSQAVLIFDFNTDSDQLSIDFTNTLGENLLLIKDYNDPG